MSALEVLGGLSPRSPRAVLEELSLEAELSGERSPAELRAREEAARQSLENLRMRRWCAQQGL